MVFAPPSIPPLSGDRSPQGKGVEGKMQEEVKRSKLQSQGSKVKMREYDLRLVVHDVVVDARWRLVISGS